MGSSDVPSPKLKKVTREWKFSFVRGSQLMEILPTLKCGAHGVAAANSLHSGVALSVPLVATNLVSSLS